MLGNFVLMMATSAAYTLVKVGENAWAWMMERASRPLQERASERTGGLERTGGSERTGGLERTREDQRRSGRIRKDHRESEGNRKVQ